MAHPELRTPVPVAVTLPATVAAAVVELRNALTDAPTDTTDAPMAVLMAHPELRTAVPVAVTLPATVAAAAIMVAANVVVESKTTNWEIIDIPVAPVCTVSSASNTVIFNDDKINGLITSAKLPINISDYFVHTQRLCFKHCEK